MIMLCPQRVGRNQRGNQMKTLATVALGDKITAYSDTVFQSPMTVIDVVESPTYGRSLVRVQAADGRITAYPCAGARGRVQVAVA